VPPDEDQHDGAPHQGWKSMRAQEENHAFILRVRLVGTSERILQAQFSVEEVGALGKQQFATFQLALEWLGERINEIVPGQVEDRSQP
jgi:hypothetical protein